MKCSGIDATLQKEGMQHNDKMTIEPKQRENSLQKSSFDLGTYVSTYYFCSK